MENAATTASTPDTIDTNDGSQENASKMEEVPIQPPKEPEKPDAKPEAQPKRRGRPAGAKDKAPRKSRVVEVDVHIPAASTLTAPEHIPALVPAPFPVPLPEPELEVEPLTPRRLYRETAAHLVHLKQMLKSDKKKVMAEAYTKKLNTLS